MVLLDYVCVSVYTLGFSTLTGILRCIIDYEDRNEMLNWRLWEELLGKLSPHYGEGHSVKSYSEE